MIIPTCRCNYAAITGTHHPHCPAVAEPQPMNHTQASAQHAYTQHFVSNIVARDIVFRKDDLGNPLFPNLAAHFDPA